MKPGWTATGADVQQVRPPLGSPDVSRLSGDLDLVAQAIEIGRQKLLSVLGAVTRL